MPMKKTADIGYLLAPIVERNPDMIQVGNELVLQPLNHVFRCAILTRGQEEGQYRACLVLSPTFFVDYEYESALLIGLKRKGPFNVALDYPQDRVSAELCSLIETKTLPLLRSMTTLEAHYNAEIGSWRPISLWPEKHFLLEVAMGNFDAARMLMRWHRAKRFSDDTRRNDSQRAQLALVRTLCNLIDSEDHNGVADLLREMEELSTTSYGVHHLWKPTPFPFEVPAALEAG